MKRILQSARSGELELVEGPAPTPQPGQLFVRNHYSVVSPGTERLMLEFARKSLAAKARSRPDLVSQVVRKLRQEGPLATYRAVMTRLEAPQPLGYSAAGVVEEVGPGVQRFRVGDRVACAGAGYANHAEFIVVPENLAVPILAGLPLQKAAFATVGAIAMQGVRIGEAALGEIVAVVGLGLIGQLAVQLLAAAGCRVIGLDLDAERTRQALELGAEWAFPPDAVPGGWREEAAAGQGADLAPVTAASSDAGPLTTAAELCRKRGRVVVVGMMPMELGRRTFYDRELELRMSTSYGPGRYDRRYEDLGLDYPLPYVRWTENRNLASFLDLAARDRIDPLRMGSVEEPFEPAEEAYERLARGEIREPCVLFRYAAPASPRRRQELVRRKRPAAGELGVAAIGAGSYATSVLLPALGRLSGLRCTWVVTASGASGLRVGERRGFAHCGTDPEEVFADPETALVLIATRHDSHAQLAARALRSGKAVWAEKPAGLSPAEIDELGSTVAETGGFLCIGFNRRFSTHARAIRELCAARSGPLAIRYRIAAGPTPVGSWITDPTTGGRRIVGEVCHFVDLCTFLAGGPPESVYAHGPGEDPARDDATIALVEFADGSAAVIEYLTSTDPGLPKDHFAVSCDGWTAYCENFRATRLPKRGRIRSTGQDKGQERALRETLDALRSGGPAPFRRDEIRAVSLATMAIERSACSGRREPIEEGT